MKINNQENIEFRNLHSTLQLKLTWADLWKIATGKIAMMSFCVKIRLLKKPDNSLEDIDIAGVYTNVVITAIDEEVSTIEANFNNKDMHS